MKVDGSDTFCCKVKDKQFKFEIEIQCKVFVN